VKKILLAGIILLLYTVSEGQSRKHVANFSSFQQYYNPAFTGSNGTLVKAYYRNQWAGFDGAPKTIWISAEMNLNDNVRKSESGVPDEHIAPKTGIRHSIGLSVLHDSFGPFVENQIFTNYKSSVNLTRKVQLQAGATLAIHTQRLDGSKLTSDEANDPSLSRYMNQTSKASRFDFNIGIALSGEDFYVGYAMQNLKGDLGSTKDNFFTDNSELVHVVQGGYRKSLNDKIGLTFNGLMRYDDLLKDTWEGQLKGVFYNTAWIGFGYRKSLAYSLHAGFRMKQLLIGYAFEVPTGNAQMVGSGTNEIVLTYDLQKLAYPKLTRKMSIW
jgi:type IX secretion system PorP/SprF family membrane protein